MKFLSFNSFALCVIVCFTIKMLKVKIGFISLYMPVPWLACVSLDFANTDGSTAFDYDSVMLYSAPFLKMQKSHDGYTYIWQGGKQLAVPKTFRKYDVVPFNVNISDRDAVAVINFTISRGGLSILIPLPRNITWEGNL